MEARLKGRRGQRDMRIQWWVQLKRLRLTREIPQPEQAPFRPALLGHGQFIAGDVKGRALPAVRRLDLDQPREPVRAKLAMS